MIKLFEISNGNVIPTEHCYIIEKLKAVIDNYPDNYIKVFAYIYYMTAPTLDNPYFEVDETIKEQMILKDIGANFSTEDRVIVEAKELCEKLYETPTVRAYIGIKQALDRLANYLSTADITDGRDGNGMFIIKAAKEFNAIRQSYKGIKDDLLKEQGDIRARADQKLAYDQR